MNLMNLAINSKFYSLEIMNKKSSKYGISLIPYFIIDLNFKGTKEVSNK